MKLPRPGFPRKPLAVLITVHAEDRWFLDWSVTYVDGDGDEVPAEGGRGGAILTDLDWTHKPLPDPVDEQAAVFAHLKKGASQARAAGYPVVGYYTAAFSEGYPKRADDEDVEDARRFQHAIGGGPVTLKDSYGETAL